MTDIENLGIESPDEGKKKDASADADPQNFGALETSVNDAAKRVNAIWITFMVLCVYIFIATFTVGPNTLFKEAPVKLPIFNAELPLKTYFLIAPSITFAVHFYLIVLVIALAEKITEYETLLSRQSKKPMANMPTRLKSGRETLRSRLDNSVILRALVCPHRESPGYADYASIAIAGFSLIILPVGLLTLNQLIFLPFQNEAMTWMHRAFVIMDFALCTWMLASRAAWRQVTAPGPTVPEHKHYPAKRTGLLLLVAIAPTLSVFVATFPGENIYDWLKSTKVNAATVWLFEGPRDPVDYVTKGGTLPFPNRLILPDATKLVEAIEPARGDISLSVRGRNFRKAVFDRSSLRGADFSASDLTEASFQSAKLNRAKFDCGTPGEIIFEPYERNAEFGRKSSQDCVKLDRANMSDADLDEASFREAGMSNVFLIRASLKGASFKNAEMNGAVLQAAILDGADFENARLLGANLHYARGLIVNFNRAQMTAVYMSYARFLGANFSAAWLQGADMQGSSLQAADFGHAHMQGADLTDARLQGASFRQALLQAATFKEAALQGASLEYAALQEASLQCVKFFRTNLSGADRSQTEVTASPGECRFVPGTLDTYAPRVESPYTKDSDSVPSPPPDTGWRTIAYRDEYDPLVIQELENPEKLTPETFTAMLESIAVVAPNAPALGNAFERLKPGAWTAAKDAEEKNFWSEWAKRSAPAKSHMDALAQRLAFIACRPEGAPYVAGSMLFAQRFQRLGEAGAEIEARLKTAAESGGLGCEGALGLRKENFPESPAKSADSPPN